MKKDSLKRMLGIEGFDVRIGGKHILIYMRDGMLLMTFSKSTRHIDGPFLRAARRRLMAASSQNHVASE